MVQPGVPWQPTMAAVAGSAGAAVPTLYQTLNSLRQPLLDCKVDPCLLLRYVTEVRRLPVCEACRQE